MTSDNFIFWLHGFFEIGKPEKLSADHVQEIKNHIDLVLKKPSFGAPLPSTPCAPFYPEFKTGIGPTVMINRDGTEGPFPFHNHTGWSPFTGDIYFSGNPPTGIKITPLRDLSGYWPNLAEENKEKVFITISREPIYNEDSKYSYYPTTETRVVSGVGPGNDVEYRTLAINSPILNILSGLGVSHQTDKVYCVVDNKLNPKDTKYNNLSVHKTDHLIMASTGWAGILNVGVREGLMC